MTQRCRKKNESWPGKPIGYRGSGKAAERGKSFTANSKPLIISYHKLSPGCVPNYLQYHNNPKTHFRHHMLQILLTAKILMNQNVFAL